ncbi:MAG: hypothetical protein JSS30_00895 [Verrucomicrobia bacterium]|nr:hypothetical protein [Verrucomicrobiota bacterium]
MGRYPTFNYEKNFETLMKTRILTFLVDFYTLIFFVLSCSLAVLLYKIYHMSLSESLVRGLLFSNVGIRGVLACIANFIPSFADEIAVQYGWPKGQSFQREIASADGAFGVMGCASIFFPPAFALATALGFFICTFLSELSGLIEVRQDLKMNKYSISRSIITGMCIDLGISVIFFSFACRFYLESR